MAKQAAVSGLDSQVFHEVVGHGYRWPESSNVRVTAGVNAIDAPDKNVLAVPATGTLIRRWSRLCNSGEHALSMGNRLVLRQGEGDQQESRNDDRNFHTLS